MLTPPGECLDALAWWAWRPYTYAIRATPRLWPTCAPSTCPSLRSAQLCAVCGTLRSDGCQSLQRCACTLAVALQPARLHPCRDRSSRPSPCWRGQPRAGPSALVNMPVHTAAWRLSAAVCPPPLLRSLHTALSIAAHPLLVSYHICPPPPLRHATASSCAPAAAARCAAALLTVHSAKDARMRLRTHRHGVKRHAGLHRGKRARRAESYRVAEHFCHKLWGCRECSTKALQHWGLAPAITTLPCIRRRMMQSSALT